MVYNRNDSMERMMQHIAIIMDGNRRWARKNKFETVVMGHKKGVEPVKKSIQWCLKHGVKYLSLYTFSLENNNRSPEEKNGIFSILADSIEKEADELFTEGIAVRFVGDRTMFPEALQKSIKRIEEKTAHGTKLLVQVLFFYGGQQEIVYAAQSLAQKVQDGSLQPKDITLDLFQDSLWTAGVPNPDMVIRSGGKARLSNYLLFQVAYSELFFLDTLWPDFSESDLDACVDQFNGVARNFGR